MAFDLNQIYPEIYPSKNLHEIIHIFFKIFNGRLLD